MFVCMRVLTKPHKHIGDGLCVKYLTNRVEVCVQVCVCNKLDNNIRECLCVTY